MKKGRVQDIAAGLKDKIQEVNGIHFLSAKLELDAAGAKDLAFSLERSSDRLFAILGTSEGSKANLTIIISNTLVKEKNLHAGNIIRELAKEIKGGGGGQPHFASAGGKDPAGIDNALQKAKSYIS